MLFLFSLQFYKLIFFFFIEYQHQTYSNRTSNNMKLKVGIKQLWNVEIWKSDFKVDRKKKKN